MENLIKRFIDLFDGYDKVHGLYGQLETKKNGKVAGRAHTVSGKVTPEVVKKHFNENEDGLGVIPLRADNSVLFGAIDLDIVGAQALKHTIVEIEETVKKMGLPLVACSTKSNGIHLYCFTAEPIEATLMIKRLKEWSALLGYGGCEIFPKQSYRVSDSDFGNWINLPYCNAENSKRVCYNKGKPISLEEFLDLAEIMKISNKEMSDFQLEEFDESLDDAPPCLQILHKLGIDDGSRNNGLYNFAVYFKKKEDEGVISSWSDKIIELNDTIVTPPLSTKELETITKSNSKKDYFYKCNEYPICQHCNKTECKKRKYGIGYSSSGIDDSFELESLTKLISGDEVIWFAEYDGKRMQLSTDDLLNQSKLQKRMVEVINKTFQPMKPNLWMNMIDELLNKCSIIEEPIQASRKGQFLELLDAFLTEGVSGEEKDDLLKYNTFLKDGTMYFRSFNLFNFLKNKRFKHTENEVWMWMKDNGGGNTKIRVAKKPTNVWSMPAPEKFQVEIKDDSII